MASPTQRSLQELRRRGYICQVVEYWNHYAGRRIDLFSIIDIIAIRDGEILGVQATSYSNIPARLRKARNSAFLAPWTRAGGQFAVWGWKELKERVGRKKWVLVERDVEAI